MAPRCKRDRAAVQTRSAFGGFQRLRRPFVDAFGDRGPTALAGSLLRPLVVRVAQFSFVCTPDPLSAARGRPPGPAVEASDHSFRLLRPAAEAHGAYSDTLSATAVPTATADAILGADFTSWLLPTTPGFSRQLHDFKRFGAFPGNSSSIRRIAFGTYSRCDVNVDQAKHHTTASDYPEELINPRRSG